MNKPGSNPRLKPLAIIPVVRIGPDSDSSVTVIGEFSTTPPMSEYGVYPPTLTPKQETNNSAGLNRLTLCPASKNPHRTYEIKTIAPCVSFHFVGPALHSPNKPVLSGGFQAVVAKSPGQTVSPGQF